MMLRLVGCDRVTRDLDGAAVIGSVPSSLSCCCYCILILLAEETEF